MNIYNNIQDLPYVLISKILSFKDITVLDSICFSLICKKLYQNRDRYLTFGNRHLSYAQAQLIYNRSNHVTLRSYINQFHHILNRIRSCYLLICDVSTIDKRSNYYDYLIDNPKMNSSDTLLGKIPANVKSLRVEHWKDNQTFDISDSFQSIENISILSQFKKLTTFIGFKFEWINSLPPSITTLKFAKSDLVSIKIEPGILPSTITDLDFGDMRNFKLQSGSIPSSVRNLKLRFFEHSLVPGIIPNSVKELDLSFVGQDFSPESIPNSVESLISPSFPYSTKSEFLGILSLPSIKSLSFNTYTQLSRLPPNLESLKFYGRNNPVLYSLLPPTLKKLTINNSSLAKDILDNNAHQPKRLILKVDYPYFNKNTLEDLPLSVEIIKINSNIELRRYNKSTQFIGYNRDYPVSGGFITTTKQLRNLINNKKTYVLLGRIGFGTFSDTLKPNTIQFDGTSSLDVKIKSFCAENNVVWMCGESKQGQSGNSHFESVVSPTVIDGIVATKVRCWDVSLAIGLKGELYSWGPSSLVGFINRQNNDIDADNDNGNNQFISIPTRVISLSNVSVSSVACSTFHCTAISDAGVVYSWGYSGYGRLGVVELTVEQINNDEQVNIPTLLTSLSTKTRIQKAECGQYHTLFLTDDNQVYSCGSGDATGIDIENQDTPYLIEPTLIESLNDIVDIAAGYYHSLALNREGRCFVFGANYNGQFGNGNIDDGQSEPTMINALSDITIKSVYSGACHNCLISDNGELYVFGGALVESPTYRMNVALGDGSGGFKTLQFPVHTDTEETVIIENKLSIKPVSYLTNIVDDTNETKDNDNSNNIAMNKEEKDHLNFLLSEQLHQSEASNNLVPQRLSSIENVVLAASGGWVHTMALTKPNKVIPSLKHLVIDRISKLLLEYSVDDLKLSIPSDLFPEINSYLLLTRKHNDQTLRLLSSLVTSDDSTTDNNNDSESSSGWNSYLDILSNNYQFHHSYIYSLEYKSILASNFNDESNKEIKSIIKKIDDNNNKFEDLDLLEIVIDSVKHIIISKGHTSIVAVNYLKHKLYL
ncbi:regulator of chromosome condensation domain-containing protein [Heterostelium album PN500]|uniref:Regulator of chromosome condensation domain-containing protein n=1 Tax=Heterostelium pallidum (strain ATCC 26659 / Pp 5 / PN500) TaxID=670386 RepID=D3BGV2_HETP5|nr:regulator of chromosome condensation domain-containing protein [Heterostelium album PN500]EFA79336.1 regulator of chromosome condensation domain-containing protein [Heterostelium album PN500]|eukprot:XP_020431457.1 regulator of chromosome condensation domain-containing protein [Heterostelium album PN500]